MSIGTQKFRPYFTANELLEVITALKEKPTSARIALARYLDGFALKIERGTMEPQHILKGSVKQQFTQSLGLDTPAPTKIPSKQVYDKWTENPAQCSPAELMEVQMYRFHNDLMTGAEEAEYLVYNGVNY